jgi:ribonuclease HI
MNRRCISVKLDSTRARLKSRIRHIHMLDPRAIHIHIDGSCLKNPGGQGGAAAIAVFPEFLGGHSELIVDEALSETTNNRMELVACIRAIQWVRHNKPWPGVARVQIITDSKYLNDNLNRAASWLGNAGRNVHGEAKHNVDLWAELIGERSIAGIRIDLVWERGKTSAIAKRVDKAAKAAAARAGLYADAGFKAGKLAKSHIRNAATVFPASGQSAIIYVYRKNAVQKDNQVRFDLFDERASSYVGSYYAYASDELTLALHRGHRYRVRFNNNRDRPVIRELVEETSP